MATKLIDKTIISKTKAVPKMMLLGIFGICVEIMYKWYGKAMTWSNADWGR